MGGRRRHLAGLILATIMLVETSAGYVMVSVQPDDAEVRIDGELITVKPYRIAVDAKGHRLVVSKAGLAGAESISIKDHGRTIEAKLTPVVAAGGPQAPAGQLAIRRPRTTRRRARVRRPGPRAVRVGRPA